MLCPQCHKGMRIVALIIEPWLDDPFPDYDNEPVFAEN